MKKFLCTDCGFLNWSVSNFLDERGTLIRHTEIIDFWRNRFLNSQESGTSEDNEYQETYTASCLRRQWIFSKSAPENTEIRYASVKSLVLHANVCILLSMNLDLVQKSTKRFRGKQKIAGLS